MQGWGFSLSDAQRMAHAARLNLRLQKEVKLLLSQPPLGVSFSLLSDCEFSLSSLSNFEARIEGPEGTVYSKGVFTIKIHIPERYPFQPPIVTFLTPIYHPNIDNGGRICLDILNLPPKGSWRPSLNIFTVLTSIGVLLNEPNPDDGLMAEASHEYKYNRQVFDLKAQSWTKKYAHPGATGSSSGAAQANFTSMTFGKEDSLENEVNGVKNSRKKLRVMSKHQSLELKQPSEKYSSNNKDGAVPTRKLSLSSSNNSHKIGDSTLSHEVSTCEEEPNHGLPTVDPDRCKGKEMEGDPETFGTVVVSDSEESDDEQHSLPPRPRFSILQGKVSGSLPLRSRSKFQLL